MRWADFFGLLAANYRPIARERFDFAPVQLAGRAITGMGVSGAVRLEVTATAPARLASACSICGRTLCAHARALTVAIDDGKTLADVDERHGAATRRVLRRPGDQKADAWQAQFSLPINADNAGISSITREDLELLLA